MMTKLTFLGTGTSQGVPIIGCKCEVCSSPDPLDQRLRSSIRIDDGQTTVVIDAGPDFRQQMIQSHTDKLDALLITHAHMDHVAGLDDIRPYNHSTGKPLPVYAETPVQNQLRKQYDYAFKVPPYPGVPQILFNTISGDSAFHIGGLHFEAIRGFHKDLPVLGFRCGRFAYLTDINLIPESEWNKLSGINVMVLSALHYQPHYSHFNVNQAIEVFNKIGAAHNYITHISHKMGLHNAVNPTLPDGIQLAYDGLQLQIK
jgi:phosphoribosyl 1,2-cyclic phosphate phosphodiesterase